jgi:hypothetical protein
MKNEIIIDGIKIDVRSNKSLYITIGDWTYYIDDSTNEQIIDKWISEHIKSKKFLKELKNGNPQLAKSYYRETK